METKKTAAIVLSAGYGKRMNADRPKQYLLLNEKPIIYYALKTFEDSFADEIILVCGAGDIEFCQNEIVNKYDLKKVKKIVEGGTERYDSVWKGVKATDAEYVFIHDGARPFISKDVLNAAYEEVKKCGCCVVGVPVKDTVKIVDGNGVIINTPNRKDVYQIQTPQVFRNSILKEAYEKLYKLSDEERIKVGITDDSMLVETFTDNKVCVVPGDYCNIKITTREDMILAEEFVKKL